MSSSHLTSLGLKEEHLNLLRNDLIKFHCGPLVYRIILHWGFAKPDGIKIIDHINDLKIGEKIDKKNFPKWLKDNKSKLDEDSFSNFDITALHDLLPILCYDKIPQTGGKEYDIQVKDPDSVVCLVKKIKNFRNDVSHDHAEAVKDNISKLTTTMRECISAAGKLYGKDQTEIDDKVKELDDEFDEVLHNTTHFYENRVNYIANLITKEVPANMVEIYSKYFFVPLLGSSKKVDTSDIFQCSNLSVTTEDKGGKPLKDTNNKTIFPCTKIFNNKTDKFVVINGGPGSGKTTLMRNMCKDMLMASVHGSAPKYDNIEQFKIPVYVECRFEQQTNLAKFLRDYLDNFLSPEEDIYEAFKIVEGLVFLIDGYDEINQNCRKLVDSIIIFCKDNNASCIVSSRVDAGNDFVKDLQDRSLNCNKMFIEPIIEAEDKMNFICNYADVIDNSINKDKLIHTFENLTEAAKDVFSSPILLTLFISLFVQDPDSVSELKNEHSVYKAVRNNFLIEIARKLKNAPNSKRIAEKVVNLVSFFCLKLFKANKYFLEDEDYSKLLEECEEIRGIPVDIDIPSLLSCILIPEQSLKLTLYASYHFIHSTIQEFLAAKYVSKNFEKLQDDMNLQGQSGDKQLLRFLGLDESLPDALSESNSIHRRKPEHPIFMGIENTPYVFGEQIGRYGNVIKFLILEVLANGEMPKYRNTFTQLLNKYFKPQDDTPVYHLDLILSSGSNADIISFVSDCMKGWNMYILNYCRLLKPMTEVVQSMKTGVSINFSSFEVTNTQPLIKLLSVLGDDSQIRLDLFHSYNNYQPLDEEFYAQLKNFKCKITELRGCIASEEHLSIVVKVLKGEKDFLTISTPSVSDIRFAALEEYKGYFELRVKYTDNCPSIGDNPVKEGTTLTIETIPADGKEQLYNIVKYICPKLKQFRSIDLDYCHLTDTDAEDLLKKLHEDKIKTELGEGIEVKEKWKKSDKSRSMHLHLNEGEPPEALGMNEDLKKFMAQMNEFSEMLTPEVNEAFERFVHSTNQLFTTW